MFSSMEIIATEPIREYYAELKQKAKKAFDIAVASKKQGKDLSEEVECRPTADLADRCEVLVGPKGIAKRYRELMNEFKGDRMRVMFRIFEEIIDGRIESSPDREKRLDQAIRTCLVLVTEGVVVSPIDGVPRIKISKNFDGTEFVDIYYAGPIRAAGGSAAVFPLILGDYGRKLLGLDIYKATQDEIERYVEEMELYEEIYARQYKMSGNEIRTIIQNCPVCINGEPVEQKEVSAYRDLPRIPSNRVRGGACLVMQEGISLKPHRILAWAKTLNLDWRWLEKLMKVEKTSGKTTGLKKDYQFLARIAAGRPILSYPMARNGFRLRYGHARNIGLMGKGIHPATMYLLDEFIACGTQLKIERPGKAAEVFPVDSIDGPIVLMDSGKVKKIESVEEAKTIYPQVKKILFVGDLLVTLGDFRKTAHPLVPSGYVEEWWREELKKALSEGRQASIETGKFIKNPWSISQEEAVQLSIDLGIPLHPKFIYYYSNLSNEELVEFIKALKKAKVLFEADNIVGLEIEFNETIKELMERIGLEHELNDEGKKIIVGRGQAYSLLKTFGCLSDEEQLEKISMEKSVLANINAISPLAIKDKSGTWIGARMGRPEQAKPRKMIGDPHVLFPIGNYGGATRSMNKAMEKESDKSLKKGLIEVDIALFHCNKCNALREQSRCPVCGERTALLKICPKCGRTEAEKEKDKCKRCGSMLKSFDKRKINLHSLMLQASKNIDVGIPELVKGVRGMVNETKLVESIEKGLLRAKHGVHIFKDGTTRYESLNAPLTHFKPKEIGLSVEKARELGYNKDIEGKELADDWQLLELMPQDIILHDEGGTFFVKVANFIDDLLLRYYHQEPLYNVHGKEDLIGHLFLGLAPHTSAAVVGRLIGFTKSRLLWAHPYFHMAKRRNIDGDQDSVLLLMDALLNFSQAYLSSGRGGRMDAPLVFTTVLNPKEVDSEIYELETCESYPLDLYEKAMDFADPKAIEVDRMEQMLGTEKQYSGMLLTHSTETFDEGPKVSRYVQLKSMKEKIHRQARLQNKIVAVEHKDALERVLASHFMPDIIGNARAFSRQTFRCGKCNEIYRRTPLKGTCKCGNKLILTVAEGSVTKYLEIAKEIIQTYHLSNYLMQRISLVEKEINSIFKNDKQQQVSLAAFM